MGLLDEILELDEDRDRADSEDFSQTPTSQLVTGGPGGMTYAGSDFLPENLVAGQNRAGVYQDKQGDYTAKSSVNPRPYPVIQNLAQLVPVLKALSDAPEDMKTILLSRWTGIPLTTSKVQQLQNVLAAAKARAEESRPFREESLKIRREQAKQSVAFRRQNVDLRHQGLVNNTLMAMGRLTDAMSNMMPSSPDRQELHQIYLQLAKQYKELTKIDLTSKEDIEEAGQSAQSAQPGQQGVKVTRIR